MLHGKKILCQPLLWVSCLLLGTSALAANEAPDKKGQPSIATVNQQPVGEDAFALMLKEQLVRGASDTPQLRQALRNELIVQTVLSQQALSQRLDKEAEAKTLLEAVRRNALAQLWQQDWLKKHPVKKEALEEEYKDVVTRLGPDEYLLRHVLLKDETAAKLVIDKAKAGASLESLAQEYSSDEGSKTRGGLLEWSSPALMAPGLGDGIKGQTVNQLLDRPVQSSVGWHVIRIEGKRALGVPTFEQLQPQLLRAVVQRELTKAVQTLVNQAKIN